MKEASIHFQVAQYLKNQYPKIVFRTDFAAGIKMSMGQAMKHKSLQSGRAYPDIFIAKPKVYNGKVIYCGLFIELKKEETVLIRPKDAKKILKGEFKLRKAGDWFDDHIEEQAKMLSELRELGYKAEFACGFDSAKNTIYNYLSQ